MQLVVREIRCSSFSLTYLRKKFAAKGGLYKR